MAELLTESFCERCGTRYTFEATARRRLGIGPIRRLSRGVRNFVASDDASFSEAMASAREDDNRSASARQLDAFHQSFNFCMTCRQYTCRNCWNTSVGECLSCAPDLGAEVPPAEFPGLALVGPETPETPASRLPQSAQVAESAHPNVAAAAWPTSDLRAAPGAAAVAAPPAAEPIEAAQPAAAEPIEPASSESVTEIDATTLVPVTEPHVAEPIAAVAARPAAEPIEAAQPAAETDLTPEELVAVRSALTRRVARPDRGPATVPAKDEAPAGLELAESPRAAIEATQIAADSSGTPEPVADARLETRRLLQRFRPPRDRGTAVARPPAPTGPAAEAVAVEPAVTAEPAPEPVVAVEPVEPTAAANGVTAAAAEPAEPEPAALAATPEPAAPPEPPSKPPPAVAPASALPDVAVQPTWSVVAPDGATQGEPQSATPAWATSERVTRREADAMPSAPWAARVATARPLESPVWAASSRNILAAGAPGAAAPVGIQSCVTCGLSLSANARFCRRCGTRQG